MEAIPTLFRFHLPLQPRLCARSGDRSLFPALHSTLYRNNNICTIRPLCSRRNACLHHTLAFLIQVGLDITAPRWRCGNKPCVISILCGYRHCWHSLAGLSSRTRCELILAAHLWARFTQIASAATLRVVRIPDPLRSGRVDYTGHDTTQSHLQLQRQQKTRLFA